MFPIGDDDTTVRTTPVVTYGLIAANVLFFLIELNGGDNFIREWAFIPSRFSHDPAGDAPTIFTAMFLHGGWMHLFGNMLYLYIFGDNVEDRLGHLGYLIFYLACGIAATFAQYYFTSHSNLPNVGASGAIAGVLGAYILMFPHARVDVLVIRQIISLPAIAVIGFWIVLQLFSGFGSIARTDETADAGGVAYMAHVGGFVAGIVLALLFGGRGGPSRTA
ncbi:rhomboid family intramembrane serine protease [Hyphomicrobium sp.]|jgi:membrane associated rhomboid family serine protease|uniref:rhomboid family intramembrane serine protease n=1 Tax=Hyphomicrobium sp. TaxID=82 RepID=UPI002BE7196F|nr:rhomboid family intramembrane serine protease [Hyphomicrobium sp.]HVZ05910.1 rhomboid family intramembrane serine protease [Hyphomicrobium sp.]